MDDLPPGSHPPAVAPSDDRLDSWKEIAAYLRRDVTTVQRWEKREGMPVRRHLHDKLGSVYAFRTDLDAWARARNLRGARDAAEEEPAPAVSGRPGVGRIWRLVLPLAAVGALAIGAALWLLDNRDAFGRSPLSDAVFRRITDFDGTAQAAVLSRDGRFVAFLSDRDGRMDVWLTQLGTGRFYNLTHGDVQGLVNPSVRTMGFSPDGASVTFWVRNPDAGAPGDISVWAVATLGGPPRPYLEGAAEFDWSRDGARLVYHTPDPGDPMFVRDRGQPPEGRKIFTAPAGLHAHFPVWSPDGEFIYFVQGTVPDGMDIWRIRPTGGAPERITFHNSYVSHPVLLDSRRLMYLATDPDGSGPWLYGLDVERRVAHRLGVGVDTYTSLAASADARRLVATLANPKETFWRLPLSDTPAGTARASRLSTTTGGGFSPRLGPGYLLYASSTGADAGIWKRAGGTDTALWSAAEARIIGGPAVTTDGRRVAFSVAQGGRRQLYVMNADGTHARVVTASLALRGAPAWAPDGLSITTSADVDGTPRLVAIPLDGGPVRTLVAEYSVDPVWSPDGRFIVYSGPDIGTTFPVKAVTAAGAPYPLPDLVLTRGARRVCFVPGRHALVLLRGEIRHKNLWLVDLETGRERQLTDLEPGFEVRDFDVTPDGREVVLDRVQEHSDVVLIDLPRR